MKLRFLQTLKIIKEESIAIKKLEDILIPTQVEEMEWTKIVSKSVKINISIVYESYHNINSKTFMQKCIIVRGILVALNLEKLTNILGPLNLEIIFKDSPLW